MQVSLSQKIRERKGGKSSPTWILQGSLVRQPNGREASVRLCFFEERNYEQEGTRGAQASSAFALPLRMLE